MLLVLLSIASSVSPFGMVVVIPTLYAVAETYAVDYSVTQFLISAYLFGLGVAQPVSGSLADRFGRRRVILVGFALFALASVGCALAKNIEWLIALRFLQAVGVSVGTVGSRAIVRDTHDEEGTVRALAFIAAAMGIAPMIAPVIGGWASAEFGVGAVYYASALLGLGVCVALYLGLPETQPAEAREPVPRQGLWHRYRSLLASPVFMGYTLMFGLAQGSMFSFLAVGAAVFERDFGIGQKGFGLIWGAMAVCYVFGTVAGGRITRSRGVPAAARLGMGLTLFAGWAVPVAVVIWGTHVATTVLPLSLMTFASGIITPISLAGAVSFRPEIAGTCSGLSSSLGLMLSGLFTVLAGSVYGGDFLPIAVIIGLAGTGTAATLLMVRLR